MVELWLHPPAFTTAVAEKPVASRLARRMAAQGNRVTNLRQEALYVSELGLQVVRRLDGSHDRRALLDVLTQLIARGELNAEKGGQPLPAGEALGELLPQALESELEGIARSALLVGASRSNA